MMLLRSPYPSGPPPGPAPVTDISSTISTLTYPGHRASFVGPFENAGALWAFGYSTSNIIRPFKSTDGGGTWAELTAAGGTLHASANLWINRVGTNLYFWRINGSLTVAPVMFDMVAETFSTLSSHTEAPQTDITGGYPGFIARRSNGQMFVLRQGAQVAVMGASYRRAVFDYWSGTAWSINNSADGLSSNSNNHGDARGIFVDSNDNVYLFYTASNNGNLLCKFITAANTTAVSAAFAISATEIAGNYPMGTPVEYLDGATKRIAVPVYDKTNLRLAVALMNLATTSVLSTVAVTTSGVQITTSNPAAFIRDGAEKLHSFHVRSTDDDVYRASQGAVAGAFAAEALLATVKAEGVSANLLPESTYGLIHNDLGTTRFLRKAL